MWLHHLYHSRIYILISLCLCTILSEQDGEEEEGGMDLDEEQFEDLDEL